MRSLGHARTTQNCNMRAWDNKFVHLVMFSKGRPKAVVTLGWNVQACIVADILLGST